MMAGQRGERLRNDSSRRGATWSASWRGPLVLCAVLAGLCRGDVGAQEVENIFLPTPREQRQQLSRAERALAEGDFSDAVVALGELLEGTAENSEVEAQNGVQQDYFIGLAGEAGTRHSLKAEALRLLGEMPDEGRRLYELRFGPRARALLTQAIQQGDAELLTDVTRRYFHTRAGYEATLLLGRAHLDEAQPLAGALSLERLSRWPAARQAFDPQLSVLLATCWLYAQAPDRAQECLVDLRRRLPDAKVRVAGKDLPLFRDDRQALEWLRGAIGPLGPQRLLDTNQWVMFRGNSRRNATTAGDLPLLNFRWQVLTAKDPQEKQQLDQSRRQRENGGLTAIPVMHPLAVGDTILMRTADGLEGINFVSGKRVWNYPWELPYDQSEDDQLTKNSALEQMRVRERVFEDQALGQLASDGEVVYLLTDDGQRRTMNGPQVMMGFMPQRLPFGATMTNYLVALHVPSEGLTLWRVGGETGYHEPKLAGAYFLGTPLPLQGRLYVLAEIQGEIRLVVLDARTGHLLWQQQLAHLENNTVQIDRTRRLAGATPSFSDGVLICPTSAGAAVALDVTTRALLWGYQYKIGNTAIQRRAGVMIHSAMNQPNQAMWLDATPTIAGGQVVLTPPESNELHVLDLLTGKSASWSPRPRENDLYVACVDAGLLVLVGTDSVTGIRMTDGGTAWTVPLGGEHPSGRGFLSDGHYYLPLTGAHLWKIAVAEGKVVERVETHAELGNLICHKDSVISQGPSHLNAFYQREQLREIVARRLESSPQDRWALARNCELLLQDGKREEAIKQLRQLYEAQPQDVAIRQLLVDTLLGLLREDFGGHRELAEQLDGLVERPVDRAELAKIKASGLERMGELDKAFAAVLDLAPSSLDGELEPASTQLDLRRDRWVLGRVHSLWTAANEQQRGQISEQLQRRLDEALADPGVDQLRTFVESFDVHPLAKRARLELARRLIDQPQPGLLAAELQLDGLQADPSQEVAAEATLLLQRLYVQAKLPHLAWEARRTFALRWPSAEPPAMPEGAPSSAPAWNYGRVAVENLSRSEGNVQGGGAMSVRLDETVGIETGMTATIDPRSWGIVLRDGLGRRRGMVGNKAPVFIGGNYNLHIGRARARGHLMVISTLGDVVAVDGLGAQDALLWRGESIEGLGVQQMRMALNQARKNTPWGAAETLPADQAQNVLLPAGPVSRHGVCYLRGRELFCVDPLSGATLWVRQGVRMNALLFGDEEVVIAAPTEGGVATVYSLLDGSELGTRDVCPDSQRWAFWGRNSLEYKLDGAGVTLELVDVLARATLKDWQFAPGSRGVIIGGDEFAVLQPSGEFVVIGLNDGATRVQAKLGPEPRLNELHVIRSHDQYLVAASEPTYNVPNKMIMQPSGAATAMLNGRLHALSRATGEPQWQSPATIENFGVPLQFPVESPLLVLARNVRATENNRQTHELLVLDRRDGSLVALRDNEPNSTIAPDVEFDPEQQVVMARTNLGGLRLRLTQDPAPPDPPAQLGREAVNTAEHTRRVFSQTINDLFGIGVQGLKGAVPVPQPNAPAERAVP